MSLKRKISVIALAAAILTGGSAWAQKTMTVTTRDGQKHTFSTEEVQDVTFSGFDTSIEQQGPFHIDVTDITSTSAKITVTPDDKTVAYYYDVSTRATYERYGIQYLIEDFFNGIAAVNPSFPISYFVDEFTSVGVDSDGVVGLPSDTEMVAYAMAVNQQGKCEGEPTIVSFHTLPPGDPADCTFDISIQDVSSDAVMYTITPSDMSTKYWHGVYSVAEWPGDYAMTLEMKAAVEEVAAEEGVLVEHLVDNIVDRGVRANWIESGLQNDTQYYIYVYAMDKDGGAAGPMFKKTFTTTLYDYSDANVSLSYRYFSYKDLHAVKPDRFPLEDNDRVVVQAVLTPNASAEHYAWALGVGDMTDDDIYPEDATKDAILIGGFIDTPTKILLADWDKPATFLYYGSDYYGIDGQLNRLLVNFTREGAMPAEQFSEDVTTTSAPAKVKRLPIAPKTATSTILGRRHAAPSLHYRK